MASRATKRALAGTRGKRLGRPGTLLTQPQRTVLRHVRATGTRQTALVNATGMEPTRISLVLGEMEAKNLVKRKPLPSDLRSNLVTLTAKGTRALERAAVRA